MGWLRIVDRHRTLVALSCILLPLLVAALLSLGRAQWQNTNVALILVLVVVAAAAIGPRAAGPLTALSAGVWFDVFWTVPYGTLAITDPADLETAVLLVLVGVAVSELVAWGRRHQHRAGRQAGFLAGVVEVGSSRDQAAMLDSVSAELVALLGIDAARYDKTTSSDLPTLHRDGSVTDHGRTIDVEADGLPTGTLIRLPVGDPDSHLGEFLLTAAARTARPSLQERQVAGLLADRVAAIAR